MVNVKMRNLTFEGVDSVKLDTTDGGEVVFTLEGSGGGGADTGIASYFYDASKEYETVDIDGLPMYKISDATLDTAEFHKAMAIIPSAHRIFKYGGVDLTVLDMTDEGLPGCVGASWGDSVNLISIATDEGAETYGVSKGVWVLIVPEDGSEPLEECYFIFRKK